jgi:hypothetical protein
VARKIRLEPTDGCRRDTKPSAVMASSYPKCIRANAADASTSGTLSETAVSVMGM